VGGETDRGGGQGTGDGVPRMPPQRHSLTILVVKKLNNIDTFLCMNCIIITKMDTVFDYYKPIIQLTYMSKDKQGNNLPELPRDVSITIFEYTRPDIIRKLRDKSLENILMERLTPFCKLLSKNKIAYVTSFITMSIF
jgi:hypothetical protein